MTSKKMIVLLISFTFILLAASSGSGNQWIYFHDKEIKGSVIDVETKAPIEGVIVVAMWQLTQVPGEGFGGYVKVIETNTDREGNFLIPSWTAFRPLTANSVMHGLAPEIVIYKPGYQLYHSQKYERERLPYSVDHSEEERKVFKEKYGINPAKLKKIYTDEERLENYDEWGTTARFPDKHFSKEQAKIIFDALEEELLHLSDKNERKRRLIEGNKKLREYWAGNKK